MKTFVICWIAVAITAVIMGYAMTAEEPRGRVSEVDNDATLVIDLSTYPDADRQYILEAVNRERAIQGAEPLTINEHLNEAAKQKAQAMIDQRFFAHSDPDGTRFSTYVSAAGYEYSRAGENLSENFSAAEAMEAWIASPAHYKNIVNPDFEEIGIWIEGRYIVQMFGARRE